MSPRRKIRSPCALRAGLGDRLGRSPGSRVFVRSGLPGFTQWRFQIGLADYSCGGSTGFYRFPFSPRKAPNTDALSIAHCFVKAVAARLWFTHARHAREASGSNVNEYEENLFAEGAVVTFCKQAFP